MKSLKSALLAIVIIGATACSSNSTKADRIGMNENDIYCIVYVDSGERYVYRERDAIKYSVNSGSKPMCHTLHKALTDPESSAIEEKIARVELYIDKLNRRLERVETSQESIKEQQKALEQ